MIIEQLWQYTVTSHVSVVYQNILLHCSHTSCEVVGHMSCDEMKRGEWRRHGDIAFIRLLLTFWWHIRRRIICFQEAVDCRQLKPWKVKLGMRRDYCSFVYSFIHSFTLSVCTKSLLSTCQHCTECWDFTESKIDRPYEADNWVGDTNNGRINTQNNYKLLLAL